MIAWWWLVVAVPAAMFYGFCFALELVSSRRSVNAMVTTAYKRGVIEGRLDGAR